MIIYRVARKIPQRDVPIGPYHLQEYDSTYRSLADDLFAAHGSDGTHPVPFRDGLDEYLGHEDRYRYWEDNDWWSGFTSLDQLDRWFAGYWRLKLAQAGFAVYVYEVASEYVQSSDRQCLFLMEHAKFVRHEPLRAVVAA